MIPVTQFILGNSDPLLYPSEKMTNSMQLTLNIMIMLNCLKNGLVVI